RLRVLAVTYESAEALCIQGGFTRCMCATDVPQRLGVVENFLRRVPRKASTVAEHHHADVSPAVQMLVREEGTGRLASEVYRHDIFWQKGVRKLGRRGDDKGCGRAQPCCAFGVISPAGQREVLAQRAGTIGARVE